MLFIAMRASSYKSAHRHLAASKRSIVVVVAGLAMVLGTTSVGASLFGGDDNTVLLRERAATRSLQDSTGGDQDLESETANQLNGQNVLGDSPDASTPSHTNKPAESAGSAASSAIVEQIQKPSSDEPQAPAGDDTTISADPPAADPDPEAPANPEDPAIPDPNMPGQVLGDSTTNPETTP